MGGGVLKSLVKLTLLNTLAHTFTKLILSNSKGKQVHSSTLNPIDYWVLALFNFALNNFMCFETLDFTFKCDSKVCGGTWRRNFQTLSVKSVYQPIYLLTTVIVHSIRLGEPGDASLLFTLNFSGVCRPQSASLLAHRPWPWYGVDRFSCPP